MTEFESKYNDADEKCLFRSREIACDSFFRQRSMTLMKCDLIDQDSGNTQNSDQIYGAILCLNTIVNLRSLSISTLCFIYMYSHTLFVLLCTQDILCLLHYVY